MTRKRISPEINALSTLLFVVVLALLLIVNLRQSSQEKAARKKAAALTSDALPIPLAPDAPEE